MYEPPNMYGHSGWLPFERWAASRADAIIVPSDDRHGALRNELRLKTDTLFITIRNTPEIELPLEHINWHARLGIPSGKKIFIHAGTLADWAQVPEILTSVNYWPQTRSRCYITAGVGMNWRVTDGNFLIWITLKECSGAMICSRKI